VTLSDYDWDADQEDSESTLDSGPNEQVDSEIETAQTEITDCNVAFPQIESGRPYHTKLNHHTVPRRDNSHQIDIAEDTTDDEEASVQFENDDSELSATFVQSDHTQLAQSIPSDYYASTTPLDQPYSLHSQNALQISSSSPSPIVGGVPSDLLSGGTNSDSALLPNDENALKEEEIDAVMKHGVWTQIDRTNDHIAEYLEPVAQSSTDDGSIKCD